MRIVTLGLLVALFAVGTEAQPRGAGLLLSVEGNVIPAARPYDEIVDPSRLMLADGSQLEFLHYQTCRRVVVTGAGSVSIKRTRFQAEEGAQVESQRLPGDFCIREVRPLDAETVTSTGGKIRLRGELDDGRVNRISPTSVLVAVGQQTADSISVQIYRERDRVFRDTFRDPKLPWPGNGQPQPETQVTFYVVLKTDKTRLRKEFAIEFDPAVASDVIQLLRLE